MRVEIEYVYPFPWEIVNRFCDELKQNAVPDPAVTVTVTEQADGSTAYLYDGTTPLWARTLLPSRCLWEDTVTVDRARCHREERGRNITQADRVTINERTCWWPDGQLEPGTSETAALTDSADPMTPPRAADTRRTKMKRTLEIEVPWIPDRFLQTCMGMYRSGTIRMRDQECERIRHSLAGDEGHALTTIPEEHTARQPHRGRRKQRWFGFLRGQPRPPPPSMPAEVTKTRRQPEPPDTQPTGRLQGDRRLRWLSLLVHAVLVFATWLCSMVVFHLEVQQPHYPLALLVLPRPMSPPPPPLLAPTPPAQPPPRSPIDRPPSMTVDQDKSVGLPFPFADMGLK